MCENQKKVIAQCYYAPNVLVCNTSFHWKWLIYYEISEKGGFLISITPKAQESMSKALKMKCKNRSDLLVQWRKIEYNCGFGRYLVWKNPNFTNFIVNSSFRVKTSVTYRYLWGIVRLCNDFSWFSHIS